jgi:hypothetical protein
MECPERGQPDNGPQSKTHGDVMRFAFGLKDFHQFNDRVQQEQSWFPPCFNKMAETPDYFDRSYSSLKPAFLQE